MTDSERTRARLERIGLNEATFRQVNEELERLATTFSDPGGHLVLLCECGHADCADKIQLERSQYEALRADPVLFAVVPGHEVPQAEEIAGGGVGYLVVRKKEGTPADVARATDPRS